MSDLRNSFKYFNFATNCIFIINFISEVFSLIRQPSREAIVPEVVEKENLVKANSLFAIGTYATLPIASILFAVVSDLKVPEIIADRCTGIDEEMFRDDISSTEIRLTNN